DVGYEGTEMAVFIASLGFNLAMAVILFLALGGRRLMNERVDPADAGEHAADRTGDELTTGGQPAPAGGTGGVATATRSVGVRRDHVLTLLAFAAVAATALAFDMDIGFVSIT